MDDNTACVWRTVLRHYPCTKLCVKQHSGLSMSTVLRAVDALANEGWITVDAHAVPTGGKPHADLRPSARPVYGATRAAKGWDVCALLPTGEETELLLDNLDGLTPLTVVAPAEQAPPTARVSTLGECVAAYLALREEGVYVDNALGLYAEGTRMELGALPSPVLSDKRLTYGEAYRLCTSKQKLRLQAELTLTIGTLLRVQKVFFADHVDVRPSVAAAWASLAHLLGHL